jgi:hypothetical protein
MLRVSLCIATFKSNLFQKGREVFLTTQLLRKEIFEQATSTFFDQCIFSLYSIVTYEPKTSADVKRTAEACDRKRQRINAPITVKCEPDEGNQQLRGKEVSSFHQTFEEV